MRLATIEWNGQPVPALITPDGGCAATLGSLGMGDCRDLNDLIRRSTPQSLKDLENAFRQLSPSSLIRMAGVRLLAPIPRPVHDILCLGLNYSAHAAETGKETPKSAVYFSKRAARCTGHEGRVLSHEALDPCLDYEVELAVIIGRECRNVQPDDVASCIFGYTVLNDFSARTLQKKHQQYTFAKGLDTFAAMGPWIVTADDLAFPPKLKLTSTVNGETRQNSNTGLLLNHITAILCELTRGITLEPGDIISTGTPSGVGVGFDPPRFLRSGDVVECEIEGIGLLRSHIV